MEKILAVDKQDAVGHEVILHQKTSAGLAALAEALITLIITVLTSVCSPGTFSSMNVPWMESPKS